MKSLFSVGYKSALKYPFSIIVASVNSLITSWLLVTLWLAANADTTNAKNIGWYLIISNILRAPLSAGSESRMHAEIRSGNIENLMLRPTHPLCAQIAFAMGYSAPQFTTGACLSLIMGLLWLGPIDLSAQTLGIGIFLAILGLIINLTLIGLFSLVSFKIITGYGFILAKQSLVAILSGALIPPNYTPEWLETIYTLAPFRFISIIPVRYLSNNINSSSLQEILLDIICASLWIVSLIGLSAVIWNRAARHYVSKEG